MKLNRKKLAQAILQTAQDLKPADLPHLVESIRELLTRSGNGKMLRSLGADLEEAFQKMNGITPITVTTATEEPAAHFRDLMGTLEDVLRTTVDLRRKTDPSLIGGLRIGIGDERIDFSLATALQTASSHLSSHS